MQGVGELEEMVGPLVRRTRQYDSAYPALRCLRS